jgi:hypothetical protein
LERVGVIDCSTFPEQDVDLRQALLLFDRVQSTLDERRFSQEKKACIDFGYSYSDLFLFQAPLADIDWLISQNLLSLANPEDYNSLTDWDDPKVFARRLTALLRERDGVDAIPVTAQSASDFFSWESILNERPKDLPPERFHFDVLTTDISQTASSNLFPSESMPDDRDDERSPVYEVVLQNLPVPGPLTSWEEILEFRADKDSQDRLLKLRRWMHKVGTGGRTYDDLAEELQDLLNDYEHYMSFHRKKLDRGVLHTVLTIAGKIAEDLVKVKWGALADLPFLFTERREKLIQAEMAAPGREIAYIVRARKAFPSSSKA